MKKIDKLKLWLAFQACNISEFICPSKKIETADNTSNNYKPSYMDSIHVNEGTMKDEDRIIFPSSGYGMHARQFMPRYHSINTKLTGNDISVGDNWKFIEPQMNMTSVRPGEAYRLQMNFEVMDIPVHLIVIKLDKREQILYDVKRDNLVRGIVEGLSGWKFNEPHYKEPYSRERYVAPGISHIPETLETKTQELARRAADPTSMKVDVKDFYKKNLDNKVNIELVNEFPDINFQESEKGKIYFHEDINKSRFGSSRNIYSSINSITRKEEPYTSETTCEQIIDYNNKSIIAIQKLTQTFGPNSVPNKFTIVPGEILQYKYKRIGDFKSVPISEVQPITNNDDRKEIETILRENKFEGPIYFWDK